MGDKGTFACFGDSITVTMAFWSPLDGQPKNMPDDMAKAHSLVKDYMKPDCWRKWKGPNYGNQGSMTIRWAHENVDTWLKKHNPEVALIMFGTNDLGQLKIDEYDKKTREVVDKCLANGTVVILSTIPPFSGRFEKSKEFADVVRKIAKDKQVPLSDYFAEIVKRRPDDWDGRLPKFKEFAKNVYEVPTLVSGDGVHPSNPSKFRDYSEESLRSNGYGLRNYLTVIAYADVIREVLRASK
jgi:lysophospholipase L1-like esterase